jgi:gamma-glutamylcyclotransferase (GGCT)/AIG2-like uncharacterized protein YtfP
VRDTDFIFVYGTLLPGCSAHWDKLYNDLNVKVHGRACIPHLGLHYNGNSFPKAITSREHYVEGVVLDVRECTDYPKLMSILDAYEGYDSERPATSLYDKRVATTICGLRVQYYHFNAPDMERDIETGEYTGVLRTRWHPGEHILNNIRML